MERLVEVLFRVRGIYATALTALLMERGHQPTQASKAVASRLSLPLTTLPPDVDIYDLPGKDGVVLEGSDVAVEEALNAVLEELPDVQVREHIARLNAVYKGVVVKVGGEGSYVELGGFKGLVPNRALKEGEEVVVTVVKCTSKAPLLSLGARVVGKYAKLIQGHGTSLSKGLKGSRRAKELLTLAQAVAPQGWGVRWRRSAAYATLDRLVEEVEGLKRRTEDCLRKLSERSAPSIVTSGDRVVELWFHGASRARLDEVRARVCPTMPRHHLLKAWGRAYSMVVDVLEGLDPPLPREALSSASDGLMARAFRPGSLVSIRHVKPSGEELSLTPGRVVGIERGLLKLERRFKAGGCYDGLGLAKEEGDRGLTVFKEGSWLSYTAYFSKTGSLKGAYFNVSTPPIFKPGEVSYLDLLIDVAWTPQGGAKVVDQEEVEEAVQRGWLPKRLAEKAVEIAWRVADALTGCDPLSLDLSSFN